MNERTNAVLVVDDSETVRRFLAWVLKSEGIPVLQAGDGNEALQILRARPVDLLIVDLNMPGMDGVELIRNVRRISEFRDLPIIMLTTERREIDVKLAYDAGANLFLAKPSTPAVIRFKVLSLLGLLPPVSGPSERK